MKCLFVNVYFRQINPILTDAGELIISHSGGVAFSDGVGDSGGVIFSELSSKSRTKA